MPSDIAPGELAAAALAAFGLVLRLAGSFARGSQDMEWWKAFGVHSVTRGMLGIYGMKDDEILRLYRRGQSVAQVIDAMQTRIRFAGQRDYHRESYHLPHLPLFLYPIALHTWLYRWLTGRLDNTRLLDFFINLIPVGASAALCAVLFVFVRSVAGHDAAVVASLAYWLNPLVILNSPIQGFMDAPTVISSTSSVLCLYQQWYAGALGFLALGFLHKPLGVLVAPIVLIVALAEASAAELAAGILLAGGISLCVLMPFIASSRGLSVLHGLLSTNRTSQAVSAQAMNVWWPVQYFWNVRMHTPPRHWSADLPSRTVSERCGFDIRLVGLALLLAFTIANVCATLVRSGDDRSSLLLGAALQVYGYFMLRVGVQVNHYFGLVPLLAIYAGLSPSAWPYFAVVCAIFFAQDLIFYGLGRDWNPLERLLSRKRLGWITVALSVANVAAFGIGAVWLLLG